MTHTFNTDKINTDVYLYNFFSVALRSDSGSWPPFTGFRDQTYGARARAHIRTHAHAHTHTHTHSLSLSLSIGLLCKSDRSDAETSTWQHTRDKRPSRRRVSNSNPSKRAAADPRLRPRDHQDWHTYTTADPNNSNNILYTIWLRIIINKRVTSVE
jgi:hypothetical protein